jgi:hypothetical protein
VKGSGSVVHWGGNVIPTRNSINKIISVIRIAPATTHSLSRPYARRADQHQTTHHQSSKNKNKGSSSSLSTVAHTTHGFAVALLLSSSPYSVSYIFRLGHYIKVSVSISKDLKTRDKILLHYPQMGFFAA